MTETGYVILVRLHVIPKILLGGKLLYLEMWDERSCTLKLEFEKGVKIVNCDRLRQVTVCDNTDKRRSLSRVCEAELDKALRRKVK